MLSRLSVLAIILLSSGCSVLGGGPNRDVFELRATGPAMACSRTASSQLVIEQPKATGAIDSERILIRPNALQIQYLPDAEWSDTVPVMVQTLLVRRLGEYSAFSHVGRAPLGSSGDYALLSEIKDFSANIEGDSTIIRMHISVQIVDEMSARVIAKRDFLTEVPAASTKTADLLAPFDAAGQTIFNQISDWVASRTSGGCKPV